MNIIGLGDPGCAIASEFEAYDQYKVYYINHDNKPGYENFSKVVRRKSHEEYESKYKKVKLNINKNKTVLILSGAGKISGLVLRLLEQINMPQLEVLYIKPDFSVLSAAEKTRHKIVLGVLQQYARSSLISKIYVVDNSLVEQLVGDSIKIQSYWSDINKAISSTFHMFKVFENTEPLLSSLNDPLETSNICAFGVLSFGNFDEKMFYNLSMPRCKKYFFGITEKTLNTEKDLLQRIRKFLSSQEDEKCDHGFAIYSTQYEHDYVYTAHYATLVQEENISLQK